MKALITKYALTRGIYESDGEIDGENSFYVHREFKIYHQKEYFLSEDDAIKNAVERKNKKVVSLIKQIEKLNAMSFEIKRL